MHVFKKQINIFAFMYDPAFNKLCSFIQDVVVFHTLLNKQSMQAIFDYITVFEVTQTV